MFDNNRNGLIVFMAVMVVASGGMAGIAFAAAPTIDTTSSPTSQTSDLTDGGTQAYNGTTASNFSWVADSPNSSLEITQNNTTVYMASPNHYATNDTDGDGNAEEYFYNVTLSDDGSDYSGLEANASEQVTLTFTATNNTEASSPDTSNFTVYFQNGEERAFTSTDNVETAESGMFALNVPDVPFLGSNDSESEEVGTSRTTKTVSVTNNTSEVTFDTSNTNLSDAFTQSFDGQSSGDFVWASTVNVNGEYVPFYYESAGDQSWLNNTDTYATVSSDGSTVTIHNAGASADNGTLEVEMVGDQKLGFRNAESMLSDYGASTSDAIRLSVNAMDFNPLNDPDWGDN